MTALRSTAERTVLDAVEAHVGEWYGPDARLLPGARMERRTWSIHLLPTVAGPEGRVRLVVKIPLWAGVEDLEAALEAGPQAPSREEYRSLCRIEAMVSASGDPGLAAIHPVAYLEDLNALVTERLDAVPLRRLPPRRAALAGRGVGRWLRRFHDGPGGAVERPFDPGTLEPELEEIARRAAGRPVALRMAADSLRARAADLAGLPVRVAVTHGDLGPSNVLVTSDGRVAVIDPNLVPAVVEADPAKLAAAVRSARFRMLAGRPLMRRAHPVEAAVLDGYGIGAGDVYALYRRLAAVRRWLDVEEAATGLRAVALPAARRVLAAESG